MIWNIGRITPDPDEEQIEDLFKGIDVQKIDFNNMDSFFKRKQIYVMLFYKSNERASKDVKDIFM
jgi:hypothetical protein